MDLSYTASLLYALLLDRTTLSQKNGWENISGIRVIKADAQEKPETLDKGRTAFM